MVVPLLFCCASSARQSCGRASSRVARARRRAGVQRLVTLPTVTAPARAASLPEQCVGSGAALNRGLCCCQAPYEPSLRCCFVC